MTHPGLRYLAMRKLIGVLRKQRRRLRSPSGLIFGILGLALFLLWLASLIFGHVFRRTSPLASELRVPLVQLMGLLLTVMTVTGALHHRGLYLPKEEIERLFSAPISRVQLVRYRLITSLARSFLGGIVVGLLAMWRMPNPIFAFLGALLATLTLPVLGQAVSLLSGGAEHKLLARLPRAGLVVIHVIGAVLIWVLLMVFLMGYESMQDSLQGLFGPGAQPERLLRHPVIAAATFVFRPWALMISAETSGSFFAWAAFCLFAWLLAFELTCRIPVDFRELSLQTSADVARRLNRLRRGHLGANASRAHRGRLTWRVPWLLGRSPMGAVVWRKSAAILRKARGTLVVSAVIVLGLTFLTTAVDRGGLPPLFGPILVVLIGTVYLSAGLRFDFRDDLDHLEQIKAWPLKPSVAFFATILPQSALIAVFLCIALLLRAAMVRGDAPQLWLFLPAVPFIALLWVALDNAVFLYAPVRPVPGQDGALQHVGRTMTLMLLRLTVFLIVAAKVGFIASLPILLLEDPLRAAALGSWLGIGVLILDAYCIVRIGGHAIARFDLARERV